MATYTPAQIAAMNARGKALLDPNKAKPQTPTPPPPVTPSVPSATTLARGGSRPGDIAATYNPPPPGNTTVNTSSSSSSTGRVGKETSYTADPGTPTPPPPPDPTPNPTPTPDVSQSYEDLKQALLKSRAAALEKQLGNSLANLDNQQTEISPYFYDKRNQAAAASDISALNFAQRAASRGITGNAGAMPEIYRNSALQGRIGALDQAEAVENARIERDRANLRNNFEADLTAAQAGIEAQGLTDYIDQMRWDRQFALDEAGVTGTYNGQPTIQGQSQQLENQIAQLRIEAQTIQNSYLPQTLKDEARLLQQQVESGRIDINTALAKLRQIGTRDSSSGGTLSRDLALDYWNSGIDTPEVRQILGL
jgi:hypothetical protein